MCRRDHSEVYLVSKINIRYITVMKFKPQFFPILLNSAYKLYYYIYSQKILTITLKVLLINDWSQL